MVDILMGVFYTFELFDYLYESRIFRICLYFIENMSPAMIWIITIGKIFADFIESFSRVLWIRCLYWFEVIFWILIFYFCTSLFVTEWQIYSENTSSNKSNKYRCRLYRIDPPYRINNKNNSSIWKNYKNNYFLSILKYISSPFYNVNLTRSERKLSAAINMITAIPVLMTTDFHFSFVHHLLLM